MPGLKVFSGGKGRYFKHSYSNPVLDYGQLLLNPTELGQRVNPE